MTQVAEEAAGDPPLMIRTLLLETAREPKDIPPQLAGQLARAVLGGTRYPQALFDAVVRRARIQADVNHRKAAILNKQHERAWEKVVPDAKEKDRKNLPFDDAKARELPQWMCQNFSDIRTFGVVMTTGVNCGRVRGPVQFGIARSLHPIITSEFAVTRCAVTTEAESKAQEGGNRTIGRKFTVPYGLYRVHGYVNPSLAGGAKGTGFNTDDLALLKRALEMMLEQDKSAARANTRPVACVTFKHDSALGNARSDQLFARVTCKPKPGVQPLPRDVAEGAAPEGRPPRSFEDYELKVEGETDLPEG